jgi:hypothetical protein
MFCYIHATAGPHAPVTGHLDLEMQQHMSDRHGSVCRLLCTFLNQILNDIFEIISLNFERLCEGSPTFNFMGQVYPLAFLRRQVDYMLSF